VDVRVLRRDVGHADIVHLGDGQARVAGVGRDRVGAAGRCGYAASVTDAGKPDARCGLRPRDELARPSEAVRAKIAELRAPHTLGDLV
jgi:hypothetical protein